MDRIKEIESEIAKLEKEKTQLLEEKNQLHKDKKVHNFLSRYSGSALLRMHKLDEIGLWEVRGEDENCDMAGPHHQAYLGTFEGRLEDVLIHAVNMKGFWAWGGGGSITKVEPVKVTKV